jgi:hypothetical protein
VTVLRDDWPSINQNGPKYVDLGILLAEIIVLKVDNFGFCWVLLLSTKVGDIDTVDTDAGLIEH